MKRVSQSALPASVSCEILKTGQVLSFPVRQMLLAMEEDRGLTGRYWIPCP